MNHISRKSSAASQRPTSGKGVSRNRPVRVKNGRFAHSENFFDHVDFNRSFNEAEKDRIEKAFDFARRHYSLGTQTNGDKYLSHCFRLATTLWKIKVDADTLCAAFLHALPKTHPDVQNLIEKEFGPEISKLVRGVQKFRILDREDKEKKKKDLEQLFTHMSQDLRIVFIRLSHRLYELEHSNRMSRDEKVHLARETLEIYVPLARRLGMGAMRAKLEEQAFRLFRPRIYRKLNKRLKIIIWEDEECLKLMIDAIQNILKNNDIQARMEGRIKNLYSVYRKIVMKKLSFEEVTDKIAIRIVVDNVLSCYKLLGLLHIHFTPMPGTFDDYIARPKLNGYQSLHTCVCPVPDISNKPVEIQIRTEEMHRKAEFGAAAHWDYKHGSGFDAEFADQMRWIGSLIPMRNKFATHHRFTEALHRSVGLDPIVIFDEDGRSLRFPKNSRVRDMADLSGISLVKEKFVARVNGRLCGPNRRLKDGDTIEILDVPFDRQPSPARLPGESR